MKEACLSEHYFVPRNQIEDNVLAGRQLNDFLDMFRSFEKAFLRAPPAHLATRLYLEYIE